MFVRVYGLQYPGYYCRHAADLRLAYVSSTLQKLQEVEYCRVHHCG